MTTRRAITVVLLLLLAGAATAVVARRSASHALSLPDLPSGYRYVAGETETDEALGDEVRHATAAEQALVATVSTPTDLAPVGVRVVLLSFAGRAPTAPVIADRLRHLIPVDGAEPDVVDGRSALVRADATTFAASAIGVDGDRATIVFGSLTNEVTDVLRVVRR